MSSSAKSASNVFDYQISYLFIVVLPQYVMLPPSPQKKKKTIDLKIISEDMEIVNLAPNWQSSIRA